MSITTTYKWKLHLWLTAHIAAPCVSRVFDFCNINFVYLIQARLYSLSYWSQGIKSLMPQGSAAQGFAIYYNLFSSVFSTSGTQRVCHFVIRENVILHCILTLQRDIMNAYCSQIPNTLFSVIPNSSAVLFLCGNHVPQGLFPF